MLTCEQAKDLFRYDEGELYWKKTLSNRAPAGSVVAGYNPLGYKRVRVNGELYFAHKIVWLMHHGYIPEMLDHIDNDPKNNTIDNLRLCDKTTNGYNAKLSKRNVSGVKGVYWNPLNKNWRAEIRAMGQKIEVGSFPDIDTAVQAINVARDKHHGEFARVE